MPNVSGTVFRYGTNERIQGAIVKASGRTGPPSLIVTDDDGDYTFQNLNTGRWRVTALNEDSQPSQVEEFELAPDKDRDKLNFSLQRRAGTPDMALGMRFFYILVFSLLGLLVLYAVSHALKQPETEKVSPALMNLLDQAIAVPDTGTEAGLALFKPLVDEFHSGLTNTFAAQNAVASTDQPLILAVADQAKTLAAAGNGVEAQARLQSIKPLLAGASGPFSIFWVDPPWNFLEVFFWALAGVLVYKIIEVGSYLRWSSFYHEGMPMHLSHLVTIPLQVLVAILLLSLVTIQIDLLGDNQVTLNLSNPALLAVVSFLLGSRPWAVWGLIRSAAGRVAGREDRPAARAAAGANTINEG